MSLEVNTNYNSYQTTAAPKTETAAKTESTADKDAAVAATYEKSTDTKPASYSINKMSAEERADLVAKLKQDAADREASFLNIVQQTLNGQVKTFSMTSEDMWKKLASGDFTVDEATKKQAQEDIGEDGYWGVKQVSQRLFDFASALAGDDPEKMKQMQDAMQKGFKEATKTWGKDLPSISNDTLSAANKLFEDYYKSKETVE